jgi:CubicO group peptidase (beta-lactamase class C family)
MSDAPMTRREALKNLFALTAAGGTWTQSPASRNFYDPDIDERSRAAMARVAEAFRSAYGVPGLSVAIARGGRMVYDEAFGMAAPETSERLTPAHRFRIASVSKPITSCAIFELVETGRLALGARVFGSSGVLGNRFGRPPYRRFVEDITVEHLLTHTCGGWSNDAQDPMFRNPGSSHAELISATLDSVELTNPPGQSYAYSNFGFCVLGRVIEAVAGRPYMEHVQQRILARCGVTGMSLAGNTLADRAPQEVRYYGQGGENPYGMNVRRMDSHGGWLASAREAVAFATHVDGFTSVPDILRPDTLRVMAAATPANRNYAKGWAINRANNWWHNGSLPGTVSILVRTSRGLCWAAFANTRRPSSDINLALDNMVWDMVRQVGPWRI